MIHVFADCELDEACFELRRRGAVVKVEPKTFDVLAYLVKCADRVVSKDELLDAVWPGQAVSESVLPKCVAAARRAVGDTRARPAVIRTVHGRGYRFVAPVRMRATTAAIDAADGAASLLTPFVGHAHAMERLRHGLELALAGRGRLVLLVGEPGIGKTRTAEELAAEARRRGAVALVGRASEGEGGTGLLALGTDPARRRAVGRPRPRGNARRRSGRRAVWLTALPYEQLLAQPLDAVRALARIEPVEIAHPAGTLRGSWKPASGADTRA